MWPFRRRADREAPGPTGERIACRHLRRQGLKILARNYRCARGELDVIALDPSTERGGTIAFVEVKTRTSDRYTDPESAVNRAKRERIRRAAADYVARTGSGDYNLRFDVVSVLLRDGEKPDIRHIPNAF